MRINLRHVYVKTGKYACQSWGLIAFLQRRSRFFVEGLQPQAGPVFDIELEPGHCSQSLYRARWHNRDESFLDRRVLLVQVGGDSVRGKFRRLSLLRRLQCGE